MERRRKRSWRQQGQTYYHSDRPGLLLWESVDIIPPSPPPSFPHTLLLYGALTSAARQMKCRLNTFPFKTEQQLWRQLQCNYVLQVQLLSTAPLPLLLLFPRPSPTPASFSACLLFPHLFSPAATLLCNLSPITSISFFPLRNSERLDGIFLIHKPQIDLY